jgi:SnoaL-like protein
VLPGARGTTGGRMTQRHGIRMTATMTTTDSGGRQGTAATLSPIRRSFELFNAGDLETIFDEIFDRDIDYSGDPDISALAGSPTDLHGIDAVRSVWTSFFEMFDEVHLSEIEFEEISPGQAVGTAHMVARGGSSDVPIDAAFHFAWTVRAGRETFMAAKLDRAASLAALADHVAGRR